MIFFEYLIKLCQKRGTDMSEQYYEGQNGQEKENLPVTLPKNIRQIGQPGEKHNVYIEDYVYTYLHMFLKEKYRDDTLKAAVLLGEVQKQEGRSFAFINGAIACEFSWLHEGNQQEIRRLVADHFQEMNILGWYVGCNGQDSHIQSIVKHHYARQDFETAKYFIYEDELEGELEVYGWEQNALHKMNGYYIYYEKNPQMQEFLIQEKNAKSQESPLTSEDTVTSKYVAPPRRETFPQQETGTKNSQRTKPQKVVYAACAAVLIVVAATGVSQIGNYQNLKNFQETMSQFTSPKDNDDYLSDDSAEEEKVKSGEEAQDESNENVDNVQDPVKETTPEGESDGENTTTQNSEKENTDTQNTDTQDINSTQDTNGVNPASQNTGAQNTGGQADTQETAAQNPASQDTEAQTTKQANYYTVKKGDSLMSISRQVYQSTNMVNAIKAANNIDNMDVIYEGQRLLLP